MFSSNGLIFSFPPPSSPSSSVLMGLSTSQSFPLDMETWVWVLSGVFARTGAAGSAGVCPSLPVCPTGCPHFCWVLSTAGDKANSKYCRSPGELLFLKARAAVLSLAIASHYTSPPVFGCSFFVAVWLCAESDPSSRSVCLLLLPTQRWVSAADT